MPRDGPDNASAEPASLPRLRLNPATPPPPPPSGAALPPHAAAPSAWQGAFEEASLLSPMASGAFGRSFSLKVSPLARSELRLLEEAEEAAGRWHAAATELRSLCRLALPISVTNLSAFCIGLVILSMVGRLGSFELSAAVLATTCFNVTGLSILSGFAAAMETFCGQAYGAQNYRLVGVVFQRALLLVTLLSALVALLWTQAEALLLAARQDPLLSRSAARYIQLAIPALFFTSIFEAQKRYLMAQGVVRPASVVTLIGLLLAPLHAWLFIFHLDWRVAGAAIAMDATYMAMALLLGGYILVRDRAARGQPTATWHGWSADALKGWPTYMRFALPSVVMICCEWWTFEVMILMAGWLPDPSTTVAVMGICINTSGIVWMFVTGFAMACSTRVSNSLGAGCPKLARRATLTAVGVALALEAGFALATLALRHSWARLFTDDAAVVALTASLLPVFALSLPGDGANATLQGLLRGSGRQETGAATNLCSYWLLGIPSAAFLAFRCHLGVHGLWWGLVIVNTVQGTVMLVIAARFNYAREAAKAAARVAAHRASEGGGGLHEPLLGGPQCERLEAGLAAAPLLDPAGPVEEELPAGQVLADAGMADGTAAE